MNDLNGVPRAWNKKPMLQALRLQALGEKTESLP